jgi:hypothetical protein
MNHSYKSHEIEVLAEDTGAFIQANAKFKPITGYVETLSIRGRFPSLEAAEQAVLEQAKTLIDTSRK